MRQDHSPAKTAAAVAVVGASAALAFAGCSSSGSSGGSTTTPPPTPPPTSAAPASIPGPPSGSTELNSEPDGSAMYYRYSTSQSPSAVTSYYSGALKSAGYTVTNSGSGGGGWGQYGGSGSGLDANNGSSFVAVNAGGEKSGPTYFEICTGASAASVDNCQGNNHGDSNQS